MRKGDIARRLVILKLKGTGGGEGGRDEGREQL